MVACFYGSGVVDDDDDGDTAGCDGDETDDTMMLSMMRHYNYHYRYHYHYLHNSIVLLFERKKIT